MSDGGRRTLKDAFVSLKRQHPSIGRRVGTFLARLHSRTMFTAETAALDLPDPIFTDNPAARLAAEFPYRNIRCAMSNLGVAEERIQLVEELAERYGTVTITAQDRDIGEAACICHGDFLLNNMLVMDVNGGDESNDNRRANETIRHHDTQSQPTLTMIDWELTHLGPSRGASDVGQLAAEIATMQRRHGDSRFLDAFLLSYRETAGLRLDQRFVQQVAVHFSV